MEMLFRRLPVSEGNVGAWKSLDPWPLSRAMRLVDSVAQAPQRYVSLLWAAGPGTPTREELYFSLAHPPRSMYPPPRTEAVHRTLWMSPGLVGRSVPGSAAVYCVMMRYELPAPAGVTDGIDLVATFQQDDWVHCRVVASGPLSGRRAPRALRFLRGAVGIEEVKTGPLLDRCYMCDDAAGVVELAGRIQEEFERKDDSLGVGFTLLRDLDEAGQLAPMAAALVTAVLGVLLLLC